MYRNVVRDDFFPAWKDKISEEGNREVERQDGPDLVSTPHSRRENSRILGFREGRESSGLRIKWRTEDE